MEPWPRPLAARALAFRNTHRALRGHARGLARSLPSSITSPDQPVALDPIMRAAGETPLPTEGKNDTLSPSWTSCQPVGLIGVTSPAELAQFEAAAFQDYATAVYQSYFAKYAGQTLKVTGQSSTYAR